MYKIMNIAILVALTGLLLILFAIPVITAFLYGWECILTGIILFPLCFVLGGIIYNIYPFFDEYDFKK